METKLICGYCGVRNKSFLPPVQGTFKWRCPMCMREWTHTIEESKPTYDTFKKKVVKVAKVTKEVEIIKEIESKPDFELGDEDAKKEKE